MTTELLEALVWEVVDRNAGGFSKQEYVDFLFDLAFSAKIRAEAVQEELNEEHDD